MKNKTIEGAFIVAGTAIFMTAVLPMLDSFSALVGAAVSKTINKWNITMQLDQAEGQAAAEVISPSPTNTNAIGFQIAPEPEEDWEDG